MLRSLVGSEMCIRDRAWVSVACKDEAHLNDGSDVGEVAEACDRCEHVFAVGVNCTAPEFVSGWLGVVRERTNKPLLAYPNSGEKWDGECHGWKHAEGHRAELREGGGELGDLMREWYSGGARLIGGCCRVTPQAISFMAGHMDCLLYTSDAADEEDSVDLGGRRIIKKKKKK
eukprot:TRINITY_DN9656_c0_g1_i9.p1 TRINITY_DN9656_c0_g1~~TRINITY_DN9656_c0_g1_i9.p1  ORF type:complete len:173 (+),score=66.41 TRINITY_DN9656_c0_g1_i9:135-653(+)